MTFAPNDTEFPVLNEQSVYICLLDSTRLLKLAKAYGLRTRLLRPIGHFEPRGATIYRLAKRPPYGGAIWITLLRLGSVGGPLKADADVNCPQLLLIHYHQGA
jgi:hypothetical protein